LIGSRPRCTSSVTSHVAYRGEGVVPFTRVYLAREKLALAVRHLTMKNGDVREHLATACTIVSGMAVADLPELFWPEFEALQMAITRHSRRAEQPSAPGADMSNFEAWRIASLIMTLDTDLRAYLGYTNPHEVSLVTSPTTGA
jgi:hypothetical protein